MNDVHTHQICSTVMLLHWVRYSEWPGSARSSFIFSGYPCILWRYKRAPLVGVSPVPFNSPCPFIPSVISDFHSMLLPRAQSVSGFTPFVIRREETRRPLTLGRSGTQRTVRSLVVMSRPVQKSSPEVESRSQVPSCHQFVRQVILLLCIFCVKQSSVVARSCQVFHSSVSSESVLLITSRLLRDSFPLFHVIVTTFRHHVLCFFQKGAKIGWDNGSVHHACN